MDQEMRDQGGLRPVWKYPDLYDIRAPLRGDVLNRSISTVVRESTLSVGTIGKGGEAFIVKLMISTTISVGGFNVGALPELRPFGSKGQVLKGCLGSCCYGHPCTGIRLPLQDWAGGLGQKRPRATHHGR